MEKLKSCLISLGYIIAGIVMLLSGEGFLIVLGVIFILLGVLSGWYSITTSSKELTKEAEKEKKKKELAKWRYDGEFFYFSDKKIHVLDVSRINVDVATLKGATSYLHIYCENKREYTLPVPQKRLDEAINLQPKFAMDKVKYKSYLNKEEQKSTAEDRDKLVDFLTTDPALNPKKKDASVVGRAIVGGIVAGEVGAVVGALSAMEENNKNKDK